MYLLNISVIHYQVGLITHTTQSLRYIQHIKIVEPIMMTAVRYTCNWFTCTSWPL